VHEMLFVSVLEAWEISGPHGGVALFLSIDKQLLMLQATGLPLFEGLAVQTVLDC
jgi:hypothetical protein